MSKVIGIDLGSTLSEVAVIEGGKATVVANEDGSYTTPSVVSINEGERKVGASAKRQQIVNPKNTIYLIKRFMGSTFAESGDAIKHVQYDVVEENGKPRVKIAGKKFSPEEISSYIVGKMKKVAEDYLGEEVKDAVITVPAFFNDAARQATKQAGELAGLNVLRIIAEPTAAILSSNIDMQKGGKYMVVDFGGSTLDFSVADISDGVVEILSTNGDVYLGGSDIDKLVADYVVSEFRKSCSVDISKDPQAMTRVLEAVEKAKIELSNTPSSEINIPYITIADNTPQHLAITLTRAKFEQLISPIVDKLIGCGIKAVELAKLEYKDLDGILLIGGSCRIPAVQEALTKEFGVTLLKSSNMDLAVAEGAAIQANNIVGGEGSKDILLVDVCPISLGIETMGGVFTKLIEANTTIPCTKTEVFSTAQDNQTVVTINVLQGERPMARDNKSLGQFNLEGIMPARRGIPQIEVSFDVDVNGILKVSAKDKATGKEQSIRIEGGSKLSDDEINRIKAEAEKYAEADKKAKEEADAVNKGDSIVFSQEKMLEEQKDNIKDDEKSKLEGYISEMKQAVKDKNIAKINELEASINSVWNEISQRIYANKGHQQTTSQQPTDEDVAESATEQQNDVQDAEFTEIKD
jgi:molecular chaperone DnaK